MNPTIEQFYAPILSGCGFMPEPDNHRYGPMGTCWRLSEDLGHGYYWLYGQQDLFSVSIHDFYFHEDTLMDFYMPELVNIEWYDSVSGEVLSPRKSLYAGCIRTFVGGERTCRYRIRKNVPLVTVSIAIMPAYYEDYLKRTYPEEYIDLMDAFRFIDQAERFPEMERLLRSVRDHRSSGISAKLFYEGKVAEAVSLVAEKYCTRTRQTASLSQADRQQLAEVTAYIDAHYACELPLERLSKIACMGSTKLKTSFKLRYGCTVTEYIRQRRMCQAERLLTSTDRTIGQIAQAVGYRKAGHFSELFRKSTGLLPGEYRRLNRKAQNSIYKIR